MCKVAGERLLVQKSEEWLQDKLSRYSRHGDSLCISWNSYHEQEDTQEYNRYQSVRLEPASLLLEGA